MDSSPIILQLSNTVRMIQVVASLLTILLVSIQLVEYLSRKYSHERVNNKENINIYNESAIGRLQLWRRALYFSHNNKNVRYMMISMFSFSVFTISSLSNSWILLYLIVTFVGLLLISEYVNYKISFLKRFILANVFFIIWIMISSDIMASVGWENYNAMESVSSIVFLPVAMWFAFVSIVDVST